MRQDTEGKHVRENPEKEKVCRYGNEISWSVLGKQAVWQETHKHAVRGGQMGCGGSRLPEILKKHERTNQSPL